MKLHKIYSRRKFINKPYNHSDGSILTTVSVSEEKDYVHSYAACKIRDCGRVIELTFSMGDRRSLSNNIFKVDTLIQTLDGFKKAMISAFELERELRKKIKVPKNPPENPHR